MRKLDPQKIAKLRSFDAILDDKYGKQGSPERTAFEEKAVTNYFAEILKQKRKELHLTQEQLSEKVGLKRSYIAKIEKGETDMQISSFVRIAEALGLRFSLN